MAAHKGVARLASLYATLERMRSVELRAAATAVEDVACAAAIAATVRGSQIENARAAMATGRRDEWQVAETMRSVLEVRMKRLAVLRAEREADLDAAVAAHRASRLEMEQMERVVERRQAMTRLEDGRRAQAESDDRFASRRSWERPKMLREADEEPLM